MMINITLQVNLQNTTLMAHSSQVKKRFREDRKDSNGLKMTKELS